MTSNRVSARPPRVAAWLVEMFASADEADGILGDLAEDFSAALARDGATAARRCYRRQAWRTIGDLAFSPMRAERASGPAVTQSGVLTTAAIGVAGLLMIGPAAFAANLSARALVTRLPVYHYIPASTFWSGIDLVGCVVAGVLAALAARAVGIRPMSAAFAMVAVLAVVFAVDRPIMLWLYGPPRAVRITLASSLERWVWGMFQFGGTLTLGAAMGRIVPFAHTLANRTSSHP